MVACPACGGVNTIQKQCTNTPRTCYRCCTTSGVILTCPWHYGQMGNVDAQLRLASGLVHPSIIEAADPVADDSKQPDPPSRVDPPQQDDLNAQHVSLQASSARSEQSSLTQHVDSSTNALPPPLPVASPSQDIAAAALAAVRAEAATDRATAQVQLDALQAQIREQKADAKRQFDAMMAALLALRSDSTTSQHTGARNAAAAVLNATRPDALPAPSPPPHRNVLLDRGTTIPPTANAFVSLDNDESGDDDDEVTTQSHTMLLPPAFRPTPAGTEQSAQQQLTAIVDSLSKQTGKVKFSSFAELSEALDDWAESGIAAGWSATRGQCDSPLPATARPPLPYGRHVAQSGTRVPPQVVQSGRQRKDRHVRAGHRTQLRHPVRRPAPTAIRHRSNSGRLRRSCR